MKSIRWKIMLVAFVIVFLPVYFLNRHAIQSFNAFTSKALEEEMISHAFMFGEQYRVMVSGLDEGRARDRQAEFAAQLRLYAPKVQSRFRMLSPAGVVLFDSDPAGTPAVDLSGNPEVARAMQGRYGSRWELSVDRKFLHYHSALPILDRGEVIGVAHVSRHTSQITKAIVAMVRNQRLAMLTALLFAALVSAILAQTLTRRLRRLAKASIEYARGNADLEVQVQGRDEIGDLGRAVTYMAGEIEKRNEYNRDFVSTVMHELKTPITAIKGAAEVLSAGAAEKEEPRRKFLGNIRHEADRLTRMVGELGELTRLDVETLRGQKEKVDYGRCVREILDRLIPSLEGKHAVMNIVIPDEPLPAMILPGRIEQVIANLLENAFRYTPDSGSVELSVIRKDRDVLTSVKDTGCGIPPENIGKVFNRFFTTEPKNIPREYGSGLGLAIAKSIVENHQGRIWVESPPGGGANFIFSLPLAGL